VKTLVTLLRTLWTELTRKLTADEMIELSALERGEIDL
jgi:hypothetical protein